MRMGGARWCVVLSFCAQVLCDQHRTDKNCASDPKAIVSGLLVFEQRVADYGNQRADAESERDQLGLTVPIYPFGVTEHNPECPQRTIRRYVHNGVA